MVVIRQFKHGGYKYVNDHGLPSRVHGRLRTSI
jgi:hypothetical protein